jgi:phosphatidylglycerophosphate synthase
MATPWTLVIDTPSLQPEATLGGLPVVLRLALEAQRAQANAIVLRGEFQANARALLRDSRLKLAVLDEPAPASVRVVVPSNWVIHRQALAELDLAHRAPGDEVHLDAARCPSAPYAFAPVEVVDAASARRAEQLLFRSLRKPEDGWTARWLNRYVSLSLSRWLARTPIRPNQLSVFILGIGLFGAYLASRGGYWPMLIGATLFQLQSILDGCDGELSRITFRGSLLGEWLDTVGDDLTNYSFFAGAAAGLYRTTGSPLYLVVGGVMLVSGFLGSGLEYRYLIRIGSGDLLKYPLSQATSNREGRFGFIAPLFKRDTFVLLTWGSALLNVVGATLVAFALGAVGVLGSVIATEMRLARQARRQRAKAAPSS